MLRTEEKLKKEQNDFVNSKNDTSETKKITIECNSKKARILYKFKNNENIHNVINYSHLRRHVELFSTAE